MFSHISLHRPRRSAHSLSDRDASQQVPSQLQDGRELQTRIYELDERRQESPQRRRRKTAGQTDETTVSSHENEFESNAGTVENLPDHNRPVLPDLCCTRLCSIINSVHGIRPFPLPFCRDHW